MKTQLVALCLFSLSFFACKNDPGQSGADNTATTIAPETVKLVCQEAADSDTEGGMPKHEIFLQLGDSKIKLADISACEAFTTDLYENYEIPKEALSAAGGWFAGAGDYFYVILNGDNYEVMQGWQAEEQEDTGFHYEKKAAYSNTGAEVK